MGGGQVQEDIGIVPFATPFIAGPGAISLVRNIKEIQDSVQNIQQRRTEISDRYNSLVAAVQNQMGRNKG